MNKIFILYKLTCLICFTLISFNWCFGQGNNKLEEFGWVNLGIGGSSHGLAVGINGSLLIKKNLFSLRYIYNEELFVSVFGTGSPEKISDFGLLYGLSAKKTKGFASISAGISYVNIKERGAIISSTSGFFGSNTYAYNIYSTVGIPIEYQLFLTGKNVGIGIQGFANLNKEKSFVGALLCIQLGALR